LFFVSAASRAKGDEGDRREGGSGGMAHMSLLTCVKCAKKFYILKSLRNKGLIWFCPFCKAEFKDDANVEIWE